MEIFTAASLAALALKFTSLLKYVTSGDARAALTQVLTWVVAFVAVLLASQADVSAGLTVFGDVSLGNLDIASLVLAGIALGSDASVVYDFKKARDGTDSAAEPPLGGTPG